MTPTHRRAYLDWLASGRRSRDVPPMLVLRFLHGLQRRVVEDTTHGPQTADERATLLAELEGLLDAYAECFPFLRARLLALHEWVYLGFDDVTVSARYPWTMSSAPQAPDYARGRHFHQRVQLSRLAAAGEAMPAKLALVAARPDAKQWIHVAHVHAPDEFLGVFERLYAQHFGSGIPLKQSSLVLTHRFGGNGGTVGAGNAVLEFSGLHEVRIPREPLAKVDELIGVSESILYEYAARASSLPRRSVELLRHLPLSIWPTDLREALTALKAPGSVTLHRLEAVFSTFFAMSQARLTKAAGRHLVQVFADLGLGVEPPLDAVTKMPPPEAEVALFPLGSRPADAEAGGAAVADLRLLITLACSAASADAPLNADERAFIEAHLIETAQVPLQPAERLRLRAHLALEQRAPAAMVALKRALTTAYAPERRHQLANLALQVIHSDGLPNPAEVVFLEKLYAALALPKEAVYVDLHGKTALRAAPRGDGLQLDESRLQRLQQDTADVDAMLAQVYVDEEPAACEAPRPAAAPASTPLPAPTSFLGLPAKFAHFGNALMARPLWTLAELRSLAQSCNVMLEGALDAVNEAALDLYDAPLIEGDGPFELNPEIVAHLQP